MQGGPACAPLCRCAYGPCKAEFALKATKDTHERVEIVSFVALGLGEMDATLEIQAISACILESNDFIDRVVERRGNADIFLCFSSFRTKSFQILNVDSMRSGLKRRFVGRSGEMSTKSKSHMTLARSDNVGKP